LDGNPVPVPQKVDGILLGAGERVDAIVEMNQPGVWILGATEERIRNTGLGVIVEYENQHRQPQWVAPSKAAWDYTVFGKINDNPVPPDQTIEMIFEKIPGGSGKFNTWLVNGKPYPHDKEFVLKQGTRYRLVFRNRTDDAHPLFDDAAWDLGGRMLAEKGEFRDAFFDFERAIKLYPSGRYLYDYALALVRADRFDDAQNQTEMALRADAGLVEAHELLGGLHARKQELPEAAQEYAAALALKPDLARAQLRLGTVLAAEGDKDGAAAHFREAAKGNDAAVAAQAAQALRDMGIR
jgi:hypothetical protein